MNRGLGEIYPDNSTIVNKDKYNHESYWSRWWDLNPRLLDPKSSALTKLGYVSMDGVPRVVRTHDICVKGPMLYQLR